MSVLIKSIKQTFQRKNWKWIGGIAGVLTIVSFFIDVASIPWWLKLLIVFVFLTVWAIFLYVYYLIKNLILLIHNLYVESVWGEAVRVLSEVFSYIHEIERQESFTENDMATTLSEFCNKVKSFFDKKTKSTCSVSIKVPISNFSDSGEWQSIQVKNISRDQEHLSERDTVEYKKAKHDIISNTAYNYIVSLLVKESSKPCVYLDNDVHSNPNYLSSSNRKEIPYKSELVAPIIPSRYKRIGGISFGGFLCVDSNKTDSFDKNYYDIPMIKCLADGLYTIISKLVETQNEKRKI